LDNNSGDVLNNVLPALLNEDAEDAEDAEDDVEWEISELRDIIDTLRS